MKDLFGSQKQPSPRGLLCKRPSPTTFCNRPSPTTFSKRPSPTTFCKRPSPTTFFKRPSLQKLSRLIISSKFNKKREESLKCLFVVVVVVVFFAAFFMCLYLFCFWFPLGRYWLCLQNSWVNNYLFNVNNEDTRKICEISSKLTIKHQNRTTSLLTLFWCLYY